MPKPVLTIGMIVKNEIRCMERCLKALQPLRDAVPCEVIIADTGSNDGTREVAEKYADQVFDFPWVNDFAAARNAVMDCAGGEWFISVDADETLDADCEELVNFLKNSSAYNSNFCGVIIRNYATTELIGPYSDFMAIRMVRMSTGVRYQGAIHEMWNYAGKLQIHGLRKTVFHHDGYVGFGTEAAKEKQKRNMDLLKAELKRDPHNLKTLLQTIDSSVGTDGHLNYIRMALKGIRKKNPGWKEMGPVIFRSAVNAAKARKLDEFWDWVQEAEALFPDSLYTTISINHAALTACFEKKEYAEVIRRGERYLQAAANYNSGNFDPAELCFSTLDVSPEFEDTIRIFMADACFHEKQYERAREVLLPIDGSRLAPGPVSNYMGVMLNLHAQSTVDMESHVPVFWEQICSDVPKKGWGMLRRNAVIAQAVRAYTPEFQAEEDRNGFRHAYTLFLPLKDEHELGIASAVLEEEDTGKLEALLSGVKNWEEFPIPALSCALRRGVRFPHPDHPMKMEELDVLASKLVQENGGNVGRFLEDGGSCQGLMWCKALAMAAVLACSWNDGERHLALARTFAQVEDRFLKFCYSPDVLCKENLFALPPVHRFGWYCIQAFEALDGGDTRGYVRNLREGLATCEGMKGMVEFLIRNTPQLQTPKPAGELLDLAEKVRMMLSVYAPDDPAVVMIKQSAAYQKVAHLIEGPELGVFGGLAQ